MDLLFKLFIKDRDNTGDEKVRQKYGELASSTGIFINIILFFLKLFAGFITASVSIVADALNNLSDAGSSLITLVGFRISGKPADYDHPFGHGRIEYISGLMVSFIIFLMGFELLKASVDKIFSNEIITFSPAGIIILVVSILFKLWLFLFYRKTGTIIESPTMTASSKDSLSDCISTFAVLLGLIIFKITKLNTDGYLGILVSVFILYTGYSTVKDSLSPLLGSRPDMKMVESIRNTILDHSEILGIHDLNVHNYGPGRNVISVHCEVDSKCDLLEIHDCIDLIERELEKKFDCIATIHMDPVAVGDSETERLKKITEHIIKEINTEITIHDFRIVKGPTHTNLIFDAVLPFGCNATADILKKTVQEKLAQTDPSLFAVINIDRP